METKAKEYFVDLDNTLCISKNSDYRNSTPILERIHELKKIKEAGHRITVWTARGATSGKNWEELTLQQLKQWEVPYDQLLMGKPHYDIYIDDKSFNVDHYWPTNKDTINVSKKENEKIQIVPKGWGKEIIFANNDDFCGKILVFEKNKRFSMHFHMKKRETWYVAKGSFILTWIDVSIGKERSEQLKVGDVITNERGEPHQLLSLEDGSEIFEVSTRHYDEDSYRIRKGD
jgi:capsule biosynthesis phosphatase